ncbi:hypothetical protein [Pseudorhodoferax soli]|uniref:hypothetical protein n=1 Tax=Pseudorhodoferax soli TaxID=545864 RepID=UPI001B8780A8|nr:hypothetical protein [Pseudorhodoferax soli]
MFATPSRAPGERPRTEGDFGGDLEAIATDHKECNRLAAYAFKVQRTGRLFVQSLAIVAQAQPVGGAPTWQESRVALGFAPQKRLVAHSFKFADYSFFDSSVTRAEVLRDLAASGPQIMGEGSDVGNSRAALSVRSRAEVRAEATQAVREGTMGGGKL